MYRMYIDKVLFPVTPGKLQVNINGTNKTITLSNEGEVNLIKTPGLTDISTEVLLPTLTKYPFAVYPDGFHMPDWYLDQLEKWKQSKEPIAFKMLRESPEADWKKKRTLWHTDLRVTIEDYKIEEDAAEQGFDVAVSITMKQYRDWGAKKLLRRPKGKIKYQKLSVKKSRRSKTSAKSYTVKKGDNLMTIAKKQLGNGSRWKEIYKLNKATIETWAKKRGKPGNGQWVFPGEKLKLPK